MGRTNKNHNMQQTPEQDWAAHIGITKEKAAELRRAHLEEGHGFVRRGAGSSLRKREWASSGPW